MSNAVKMARKCGCERKSYDFQHLILNIKMSLSFQMNCIARFFITYLTLEIYIYIFFYNLTLEIKCLHATKMTANNITQPETALLG